MIFNSSLCSRFIWVLYLLFLPFYIQPQNINIENYLYLSPLPGSKLNSVESTIIIKYGDAFESSAVNKNSFIVKGSKSGRHSGEVILAENNNTLIFKPYRQFENGEVVSIEINEHYKTVNGETIPELKYSFETSEKNLNKPVSAEAYLKRLYPDSDFQVSRGNKTKYEIPQENSSDVNIDSLPENFPEIFVDTINKPSDEYIFFAPFLGAGLTNSFLVIADNYGTPVYYKKINKEYAVDFKKQNNGKLTYFHNDKFYVMDSSYNVIDSLLTKNGYLTDLHDCIILNNGHTLLMSYDDQSVRMDTIVQGGDSNAVVTGLIIQELDENKNVVFQWRSWDHFKITDATYNIDLTEPNIDYVHGNAVEMDFDGNLLVSSRHMDEITKISRQTGEIIWRLGGIYCENNQFTFLNDSIGFSHQHDIRRLANGNILLFDNGNLHDPQFSRSVEYQLDENNRTALLVWEGRHVPEEYSFAMGSSRRLENQNTLIGWGWNSGSPAISEIRNDGTPDLLLSFETNIVNYRAFKFPWKTNVFSVNTDTLSFIDVEEGDSLTKSVEIINNSNYEIQINGLYNRTSVFNSSSELPLVIPALGTAGFQVTFKPQSEGVYFDDMHVQWNQEDERIAQVVSLRGSTDSSFTSVNDADNLFDYSLSRNFPNPFNPITKINFTIPEEGEVFLYIHNILGQKIQTLVNERLVRGSYSINFNAGAFPSGVYIYTLKVNDFTSSQKMILIK